MSKIHHYAILLGIVIVCASLSAFIVHKILTLSGVGVRNQGSQIERQEQKENQVKLTPSIAVYLTKDTSGVYVLPTVNPTYPLQLGPYTVGGVTACERLFNLETCLKNKKSPLVSKIRYPEATASAGLETVCGNILNDLADLRPQTAKIGCVW